MTIKDTSRQFIPVSISDSRTEENDKSGDLLVGRAKKSGYQVVAKTIVPDDIYQVRAAVSGFTERS